MKRNEKAKCETCPFYNLYEDSTMGYCQRNAPTPQFVSEAETTLGNNWWPETGPGDWCGEHPEFDLDSDSSAYTCSRCEKHFDVQCPVVDPKTEGRVCTMCARAGDYVPIHTDGWVHFGPTGVNLLGGLQ